MKRITLSLLTLSLAALLTTQARATQFLTINGGDLTLGFWATSGNGATQDYLLDLGQVSQFEGLSPGSSITLLSSTSSAIGNIGADLTATFGSNWITDSNLYWGAAASYTSSDVFRTMYATIAESTPGTIQAGWNANTASTQAGVIADLSGIAGHTGAVTANSSVAAIQNDSDTDSWESFMASSSNSYNAFSYFTSGNLGISAAFNNASTIGDDPLDLYQMVPGGTTTRQTNYIGTFTIDSSGDLTFTNAAVPEPGTYGLMLMGLGSFLLYARARKARLLS